MNHPTSYLRKFLTSTFSDEEIETFCFDNFYDVQSQFAVGMSKNEKIHRLIDYCVKRDSLALLLQVLQNERPSQYVAYFDDLMSSEGLTSTVAAVAATQEPSERIKIMDPKTIMDDKTAPDPSALAVRYSG